MIKREGIERRNDDVKHNRLGEVQAAEHNLDTTVLGSRDLNIRLVGLQALVELGEDWARRQLDALLGRNSDSSVSSSHNVTLPVRPPLKGSVEFDRERIDA